MSDQELTAYKDGEKWGFRRTDGEVVITATFDAVGSFSEGFARFRNGSSWGFLDTAGKVAIRPRFEQARHFTGGYAKVKLDGKLTLGKGIWDALTRGKSGEIYNFGGSTELITQGK